jgi:hypothetical protein
LRVAPVELNPPTRIAISKVPDSFRNSGIIHHKYS